MPEEQYRIVGIRTDGSRRVLVSDISKSAAEKALVQIAPDVFARIVIELDSEEPSSQGKRSVELFPDSVTTPPSAP